eukprot:928238-Pleurochrysis_carterae.AAC.1
MLPSGRRNGPEKSKRARREREAAPTIRGQRCAHHAAKRSGQRQGGPVVQMAAPVEVEFRQR